MSNDGTPLDEIQDSCKINKVPCHHTVLLWQVVARLLILRNEGKEKALSFEQWEQTNCNNLRGAGFKLLSLQFILINSQIFSLIMVHSYCDDQPCI